MRPVLFGLVLALSAPAWADDAKPAKSKPASDKEIRFETGADVKGDVQRPGVGIVMGRDPAAKKAIDKSREQALREAAERIK